MARVLYLSGAALPSTQASAIQTARMCDALAALGHDVVLVCAAGEGDDPFTPHGVGGFEARRARRSRRRVLGTLAFLWRSAAKARHVDADIVYARDGIMALLMARRAPVVREVHDLPTGLARPLERWLLRRRDVVRVVANSGTLARAYAAAFARDTAAPVIALHNAAAPVAASVRGAPSDALTIGYVGAVLPHKGMEVLLALAAKRPSDHVVMVPSSVAGARELRARTQGLVNVSVVGPLSPVEAAKAILEMDVVLLPTRPRVDERGALRPSFQSPLKLFEYMMSGRAIIASDLPALREVLTHDEDALLVAADDVTAWEQALRRLEDPALRERLGVAARSRALLHHSWLSRARRALDGLSLSGVTP